MSERIETFQMPGTPRVSARIPTGDTSVVAGDPGTLVIRLSGPEREVGRFVVEVRGDTVVVEPERSGALGRWTSVRLIIESGEPVDLSLRSATGEFSASVALAGLRLDTATGDVEASHIRGDAVVKSASGDVRVGQVAGRLEVVAASGAVQAGSVAGEVRVKTASGDFEVGEVAGDATVKSASGDVEIGVFRGDHLDIKTLTGDVAIGLTAGRHFDVSLQTVSGELTTEFPISGESGGSTAARLSITSVSGDIAIRSVA
jgi:DUF4097 and DUF4098 domain-containing protein YvlB